MTNFGAVTFHGKRLDLDRIVRRMDSEDTRKKSILYNINKHIRVGWSLSHEKNEIIVCGVKLTEKEIDDEYEYDIVSFVLNREPYNYEFDAIMERNEYCEQRMERREELQKQRDEIRLRQIRDEQRVVQRQQIWIQQQQQYEELQRQHDNQVKGNKFTKFMRRLFN